MTRVGSQRHRKKKLLIYNITEDVVGLYIKSILIACKFFKQSHKLRIREWPIPSVYFWCTQPHIKSL